MTKSGHHEAWTKEFRSRHNSKYRLTDRGRWQADMAGDWIKEKIGDRFDLYLTSEYIRAMETSAYLDLQGASWRTEFFLRERDRGVLANRPKTERESRFPEEMERQERDSFYYQPTGGESIANCCMRVDSVIRHLQKSSHSGLRVILVCHGGIIKAFRALIERRRQVDFQAGFDGQVFNSGRDPVYKIQNGTVVHYSRRDPVTGLISEHYNWVRTHCPWMKRQPEPHWEFFSPPYMSNDSLLAEVRKIPQLVNEDFSRSDAETVHSVSDGEDIESPINFPSRKSIERRRSLSGVSDSTEATFNSFNNRN